MPANEPVLWTIQASLKTALEAISAGPDYFYSATSVLHRTNAPQALNPGTFILGLQGVDRQSEETQGRYYWRATFTVSAIVAPGAAVQDDRARARLWSDIQRAVMADPYRTVSSTRYAIDTQVLAPEISDSYDERIGMECPIEVYFRTQLSNPTEL